MIECLMLAHDRQFRQLWFTCRREFCRCRRCDSSDDSEDQRQRRQEDRSCSDYWQKLLDVEESTAAFLTAIATLIEDTAEITLQLYIIIGHGVQENIIGKFQFRFRESVVFMSYIILSRLYRLVLKDR